MTEKTEEQIDREKQAVASMTNAKSNMVAALDRIQTLETCLARVGSSMNSLKDYVGQYSRLYSGTTGGIPPTIKEFIDQEVARVNAVLP